MSYNSVRPGRNPVGFLDRYRRGERLALTEHAPRYPELADSRQAQRVQREVCSAAPPFTTLRRAGL